MAIANPRSGLYLLPPSLLAVSAFRALICRCWPWAILSLQNPQVLLRQNSRLIIVQATPLSS